MLYNEGDLTQEQAEKIIGAKMLKRIKYLNDWLKKNGYILMLHSTFKDNIKGIFNEGLKYPRTYSRDTRDEVLHECNVKEEDLLRLEEWVNKNRRRGAITKKSFETNPPVESDTVSIYSQISAKDLLEYNHRGGNATIVFCVPKKELKKIGKPYDNPRANIFSVHADPYLRRLIACEKEDGQFCYISKYFYPFEGILFAFERDNIGIKFNERFRETYYLDSTCTQKGIVKDGELMNSLKNIEQLIKSDSDLGEK